MFIFIYLASAVSSIHSNVLPQSEPIKSNYIPPTTPTATVAPVLPANMDINELFKKLVDSGIVPKDKPKEIIPPKTKKKEKEMENLTIKPVDFSDSSSLKQLVISININHVSCYNKYILLFQKTTRINTQLIHRNSV